MTRPGASTSRHLPATADRDRGATTASFVILFPLFLLMFMAIVQWGLYWHAQAQVTAAAQDAARAAQGVDGTPADGEVVAHGLLEPATGSGLITVDGVVVSRDAGRVRAQIDARVRTLVPLPGFDFRVQGLAQGPVEQFVPETER
jgi:Flp pilus assembly protein TadG